MESAVFTVAIGLMPQRFIDVAGETVLATAP